MANESASVEKLPLESAFGAVDESEVVGLVLQSIHRSGLEI